MEKKQEVNRASYETGVTQRGKSHGGVIAVLLMLVIFLSGVVTALGLMNVRLFRQVQDTGTNQPAPVSFQVEARGAVAQSAGYGSVTVWELGIAVREMGSVYQSYHCLPNGLYITQVDSYAASVGVMPGDVLVSLDGLAIETVQALQTAIMEEKTQRKLLLYRKSEDRSFQIIWNEE